MNGMRDELCTALGFLGAPVARSECGGGGISKHELGRKWRAVPWAAVLDGKGEAPYYFMRSGLIRKDLLPCYAKGRVPFTVVVRSHDELVAALAQHASGSTGSSSNSNSSGSGSGSGSYEFDGRVDGRWLFSCTAGGRVLTGLASTSDPMPAPTAVWGIDNATHVVQLRWSSFELGLTVQPNEEWAIAASASSGLRAALARKAPFVPPHA